MPCLDIESIDPHFFSFFSETCVYIPYCSSLGLQSKFDYEKKVPDKLFRMMKVK